MIKSAKRKNKLTDLCIYIFLGVLSVLWMFPIAWVIMTSFRAEKGSFVPNFIPKTFTFDNYIKLFQDTSVFNFGKWYANTLLVAAITCVLSTFITLATAYVMSRMRFKMRKPLINFSLIVGMFPSFMSMIAVYYVLKAINLTQSLIALVLVFSSGAALKFFVPKGFLDMIPKTLDEAAKIDGASNSQVFWHIILPLSKPILINTAITSFMVPWMDFIFAKVLMGDNYDKYTASIGLYTMLQKNFIDEYFTRFAAGSVCIALPITVLFVILQKYYVSGVTSGAVKG